MLLKGESMNILKLYQKFLKAPLGKKLFSKAVCLKAPYFSTISPTVELFEKGKIRISLPKKRSVLNHIGTVHAIAMCNLAELCGGLTIDSTLPKGWRWIPKGMQVEYLKKAETSLVGICEINDGDISLGDNKVHVDVKNALGEIVFTADINMYVSEKKN